MIKISKAVIQKDNKFLLLKRSPNSHGYRNTWDFAGGRDEKGETPEQSVIRETKEETSYDIVPGHHVRKEEYHDKEFDLSFHYFIPIKVSGSLKLSKDHTEFLWVSRKDIKKLKLHPSVKMFFDL
ncbi:MAG: NUDIX domain-containing protein [Candidatus Aenigmarchaeota archaeon]|nr:NUDIX domain-containing protein [Candidatus Aenigmarchaeota archaeon]